MSQLLALSFDSVTAPSLTLGQDHKANEEKLYGWGLSWYTGEDYAATILKDSNFQSQALTTRLLDDWKKFQSTLFICHLRGATKSIKEKNTQPFGRTYAARNWVFSHNGSLNNDYKTRLSLGTNPIFEPLGNTDSELIFCWLITKMHELKLRSLKEIGWDRLHQWLQFINKFGTLNLIFSDGHDLIVYQDYNDFHPLYYSRQKPPHEKNIFYARNTKLEFDKKQISSRTCMTFSTEQSLFKNSSIMKAGQMMVVRRGSILWERTIKQQSFKTDNDVFHETLPIKDSEEKEVDDLTLCYYPQKKHYEHSLLNVHHETRYLYENSVELSKHLFRLHPINDRYQRIQEFNLSISSRTQHETFDDVFGNRVTLLQIDEPYKELIVTMNAKVKLFKSPSLSRSILHNRRKIPLLWMPWQRQMMQPYLLPNELPEPQMAELTDFAMSFVKRNDYDVLDTLKDMNETIHRDFTYHAKTTNLETTAYDVLIKRRGVCQDFTNLFISLVRLLSIPARYRMGYIYTGADYVNKQQSEASHAWVEIYLPWLGWRGFDPTNGCIVSQDHVSVACGRSYHDATPTSGTIFKGGNGTEQLYVNVRVERENEDGLSC